MQKTYMNILLLCMSALMVMSVHAAEGGMYKQEIDLPMDKAYPAIYAALEDARFSVVFEPNISKNLSYFAEKWGDDYNKNALTSIRSMVFCNGWYANAVSNADPDMLGLCPLSITLYEKQGKTVVLFAKPSMFATQSNAKKIIKDLEDDVIAAIKQGAKSSNLK